MRSNVRKLVVSDAPEALNAEALSAGALSAEAPSLQLGRLDAEQPGGSWTVRIRGTLVTLGADACVDPEALREAAVDGAPVLIESTDEGRSIVGIVSTRRSLRIDRDGDVSAQVGRFEVRASKGALLAVAGAFVQVLPNEVELYGNRVVTRAREVAKVLARMIALN